MQMNQVYFCRAMPDDATLTVLSFFSSFVCLFICSSVRLLNHLFVLLIVRCFTRSCNYMLDLFSVSVFIGLFVYLFIHCFLRYLYRLELN